MKIKGTDTIRAHSIFENYIYFISFFSTRISPTICQLICLKVSICVDEGHLEGSVSQNLHLGHSFYFINLENYG